MTFLIILLVSLFTTGTHANVLVHPTSKLAPAGVEVTFQCKITGLGNQPHWIINDYEALLPDHLANLRNQGFSFSSKVESSTTTLTLRVRATIDKNGTEVYCTSTQRSNTATLLIIEDSPVVPNPAITNPNATAILLKWSPPFLWSGLSIDHYNVSVTNSSGHSRYYLLNATYSDAVVSFQLVSHQQIIQTCNELRISVSPIGSNQEELKQITAIGGYVPNTAFFSPFDVNVTVLFKADRTPIVTVEIELLQFICTYQSINYTIIVESKDNQNRTQLGPYEQLGHETISQTISSTAILFEEDSEYTLTTAVNTLTGTITSHKFIFNTGIQHQTNLTVEPCNVGLQNNASTHDNVSTYRALMIVFICAAIFSMVILLLVVMCLCQKSRKKVNKAANRACNAMVPNPIYDGPVYESIPQSQFDALSSSVSHHSPNPSPKSPSHPPPTSDTHDDPLTARYIKKPSQAQSRPDSTHLSDQYSSEDVANSAVNNLHVIVPTDVSTSIHAEQTVNTLMPQPESHCLMPAMISDTYTLMSPAGTITASLKDNE